MNNKLNEALDKEIKRFKQIGFYQENLIKENGPYQFYSNIAEEDPNDGDEFNPDGSVPPADSNLPADNMVGNDPNGGGGAPGMGADEPSGDMGGEPGADDQTPDMGSEPGMEEPMPDMGAEQPGGDPGAEDTTEVDITDLVNNSNEVKMKVEDAISKMDASNQQFNAMIDKVTNIEAGLSKMDSIIGQMGELSKQVALMRPPTEAERRQALAKESYPFSVTMDQYQNGEGAKTQSDLEQKDDSKMSMLKTLMNNYNDSEVKDSFYATQEEENPFNKF